MNKLCVILNVLVCIATGVNAQTMESPNSYETRLSDEMKNLWQHTMNPAGAGMGFTPPRFLKEGDVVECTIEGIGTLRNKVGK